SQLVPSEVFFELMEFDTVLPTVGRDVPVLLAMSDISAWNRHLQDALALRHDRDVWAPTGLARWAATTGDPNRHV
ncbi:hypothetical protein AN219_27385, partial [Streptomyces nanshensis]